MTSLAAVAVPIASLVLAASTASGPPHPSFPQEVLPFDVPPSDVVQGEVARSVAPSPARPETRPGRTGRWSWPLSPRPAVLRPFIRPTSRWGPGHRGLDLQGAHGRQVLAVDDGTVVHAGMVAGRGTITVLHGSGIRSTYEPVDPTVRAGAVVARGQKIGRMGDAGSHCATPCLHLGAVRAGAYLDPLTLLGPVNIRLLPLEGPGP